MVFTLKNVHIKGATKGIKVDGPAHIDAENVTFDNVQTPWEIGDQVTGSIRGGRIKNDPKLRDKDKDTHSPSIGWRKQKGPPLPVFCPQCKAVFASKNHVFAGRYWSLWNNKEQCQECGFEEAQLSEGIFDLAGEVAKIIQAPDFTRELLRQLNEIAANYKDGGLSLKEAEEQISKISPEFAKIWTKAQKYGANVLMLIISVLALYYGKLSAEWGEAGARYAAEQVRMQKESVTDRLLEEILLELRKTSSPSQSVETKAEENPALLKAPEKARIEKKLNAKKLERERRKKQRAALNPKKKR